MRRIVILGCAGSGKTALARRLGERTGLPVICLDAIWKAHWTKENLPAFRALVMAAHDCAGWISDGNFAQATFDIRLPRAELVVWLERSRPACAWRVAKRVFRAGESHKMRDLPTVFRYLWYFDRVNRPLIEAQRLAYGSHAPAVHLRSNREIADFVSSVRT
jgi:adenylate kinase family enzyme